MSTADTIHTTPSQLCSDLRLKTVPNKFEEKVNQLGMTELELKVPEKKQKQTKKTLKWTIC